MCACVNQILTDAVIRTLGVCAGEPRRLGLSGPALMASGLDGIAPASTATHGGNGNTHKNN